jgi:O-glycosyl hydrolase
MFYSKVASALAMICFSGGVWMGMSACSSGESGGAADAKESIIRIDLQDRHQTIRNFGASDAWVCQYVGLWPEEKRNKVADWLFSQDADTSGKPEGIGLSLWRFNIGAGSAAQTTISDEWRRTEGFLKDDKTYDWTKQAGQRWFLQAAKQRGVEKVVAFTNSPPVQLTKNGKAFSDNGETANIDAKKYAAFAGFLTDVADHFSNEGITIDYISPFNEPQWDWTGNGQEGSPYTNQQIADITRKLDSAITTRQLPVKIQLAEAGKANYLYELADKSLRGNQIDEFFNQSSSRYLGNLPSVDRVISAHSYFTTMPLETLTGVRKNVKDKIRTASVPLEFWQSEYCILGDQEEIKGPGKDRSMATALYVARLIHHDLTVADASAWHWWLAVTAYDYKDGLIYVDKNKSDGTVEDTKLLWALGNYSRFVRPGAVRVGVTAENISANNPRGLMVSSFVDDVHKKLVTVLINYGDTDATLRLEIKGGTVGTFKPYLTGPGEGEALKPLQESSSDQPVVIPRRSVITLVADIF